MESQFVPQIVSSNVFFFGYVLNPFALFDNLNTFAVLNKLRTSKEEFVIYLLFKSTYLYFRKLMYVYKVKEAVLFIFEHASNTS